MSINSNKAQIIKNNQNHDTDTGSPEVQIAILTAQIEDLTKHLQKNKKDKHSKRGLLKMVMDRKSHLSYLEKSNPRKFNTVKSKLGL